MSQGWRLGAVERFEQADGLVAGGRGGVGREKAARGPCGQQRVADTHKAQGKEQGGEGMGGEMGGVHGEAPSRFAGAAKGIRGRL